MPDYLTISPCSTITARGFDGRANWTTFASDPDEAERMVLELLAREDVAAVEVMPADPVCEDCDGEGEIIVNSSLRRDPQCDRPVRCGSCDGTGQVPA